MDRWMSELSEELAKVPLSKLAIPGSHDSCSYSIDSTRDLSPDNDAYLILIHLGAFGKRISARWGRTQDANLTEQLSAGIRYFDLRVLHRKSDDLFYFVHGQFAKDLLTELFDIRLFLREHPKEVVILDFNHLYCFQSDALFRFVRYLIEVFETMLAPRSERIPSLKELWENGHQVICLLPAQSESPLIWSGDKITSPWPDMDDVDKLMEFIKLHPSSEGNLFHVTQGVLTPHTGYELLHLFSNLSKLATPASERVIKWLEEEVPRNQRNIIIIDFAVKMFPKFTQAVINLNSKE
ncbi:hypothetical protein Aperf_G00000072238 [Anoplocephala perfoliata]